MTQEYYYDRFQISEAYTDGNVPSNAIIEQRTFRKNEHTVTDYVTNGTASLWRCDTRTTYGYMLMQTWGGYKDYDWAAPSGISQIDADKQLWERLSGSILYLARTTAPSSGGSVAVRYLKEYELVAYNVKKYAIKGAYVDTVTAPEGAYPVDGYYNGYWYTRTVEVGDPPTSPTITSPNGGETVYGQHTITWLPATDPDTAQGDLQYHIQYSPDNGISWVDIVSLTTPGVTSFDFDFSAVSESSMALVRIRAFDGRLYGPYSTSAGVFTNSYNTAPSPPTQLAPAGGKIIDRTEAQRLSWQHNDIDDQSKFDLSWSSDDGVSWNVITRTTNNQYVDIDSGTFPLGTIIWRVRTYDQSGLVSLYSTQAVFVASNPSSAPIILNPVDGSVVPISSPTVQWSSVDQQSYQVVVFTDSGGLVWDSGLVASGNKAITIGAGLVNGESYKINVRVQDSGGIWSPYAESIVSVSYTPPAVPTVICNTQEGQIGIIIQNPAPEGTQPSVASQDIYRRVQGDIGWQRIAVGIANNGIYEDYATAAGVVYEYYVATHGDNGTSINSESVAGSISFPGVWLHDVADPTGTMHHFQLDGGGRDVSWQPEVALLKFAGRRNPVAEFDDKMEDYSVSFTLQMLKGSNDLEVLNRLAKRKGTICYRDSRSRKVFGIISALSIADEQQWGYTVVVKISKIDFTEVV